MASIFSNEDFYKLTVQLDCAKHILLHLWSLSITMHRRYIWVLSPSFLLGYALIKCRLTDNHHVHSYLVANNDSKVMLGLGEAIRVLKNLYICGKLVSTEV